jgi:hypothetical protein
MTSSEQTRVRCALAAGLLLAAASMVRAQTRTTPGFAPPADDETIVRQLLQSTDPRAQAWGAWYAGRDHRQQFVPLIQAVVAQHAFGPTLYDNAAREIALDALIQLRATLPPEQLAPVYERYPAQALILASLAGRDNEDTASFLLDVLNGKTYDDWFAAANILLNWRTARLASTIIRTLRVTAHVYITRGDQSATGGFSSGVGVGVGCGGGGVATAMPPWATYRLTTYAHPGVVVLSAGPTTVYYQRVVTPAGSSPAGSVSYRDGPTADDRLRYLGALAGMQEDDLPLRGLEFREIRLAAGASADAALEGTRAELYRQWSAIARALVHRSALSAEDGTRLLPAIDLVVHDSQ